MGQLTPSKIFLQNYECTRCKIRTANGIRCPICCGAGEATEVTSLLIDVINLPVRKPLNLIHRATLAAAPWCEMLKCRTRAQHGGEAVGGEACQQLCCSTVSSRADVTLTGLYRHHVRAVLEISWACRKLPERNFCASATHPRMSEIHSQSTRTTHLGHPSRTRPWPEPRH
eukprot:1159937-Pelagomonas_calceolata.AAC.2